MTRLRVDRVAVTNGSDRFTVTSIVKCFAAASRNGCSSITNALLALLVSFSLLTSPLYAAPSSSLGVVVFADRAYIGTAQASAGATLFAGDRLNTDQSGSVQVRAGAARLLLSRASSATF